MKMKQWKISEHYGYCPHCESEESPRITLADGSGALIAVVVGQCGWGKDGVDHAALITAAPDLLEVAQVALEYGEDNPYDGIACWLLDDFRAAIAKAKGETDG